MRILSFLFLSLTGSNLLYAENPKTTISGTVAFDQSIFSRDESETKDTIPFYDGASLSTARLSLQTAFSDTLSLFWDINLNNTPKSTFLFLRYSGIENLDLFAGQIPSPFCLSNSQSTKWLPFLKRDMASQAFTACYGPGLGANYWNNAFSLRFAFHQPEYGLFAKEDSFEDDTWGTSLRAVWAPLNNEKETVTAGFSVSAQKTSQPVEFSASPEVNTRKDITTIRTGQISALGYNVYAFELSARFTQALIEGEYLLNQVTEKKDKELKFKGGYGQVSYFITGSPYVFNLRDAAYSVPATQKDAWQIAYRLSTLDLTDKDVTGGDETNHSLALNWYPERNIRWSINYIYADINNFYQTEQTTHAISTRLQLTW